MKLFLKIFRMFLKLFLIFFRKWCCDDEDDKKTKKNGAKTVQNDPRTDQNSPKNGNNKIWNNMHFYEVFEKLRNNRALHTSPRWSKNARKKNKKKQSVSQMKDLVMTMNSVQKSSKSELSSRGKRPFKVLGLWLFFFHRGYHHSIIPPPCEINLGKRKLWSGQK